MLQWLSAEEPAKEALAAWLAKQALALLHRAFGKIATLPVDQQQQILALGVNPKIMVEEQIDNKTPPQLFFLWG